MAETIVIEPPPAAAAPPDADADAYEDGAVPALVALALAHVARGATETGAAVLAAGIARAPHEARLWRELVLLRVRRREFRCAMLLAEQAQRAGVADACVLGLLGHALSSMGRHDQALPAYAAALELAPQDPYVHHLVAAGGRAPDLGRAPAEYVQVVFDGYAPRFDAHLARLGYRGPEIVRAALGDAPCAGPVLDLGCGTGLVAEALADCAPGPFIGVDLSPKMLAGAAQRGRYAELHEADLPDFLAREGRCFPLVTAADVLPYFGDLAPLFRQIAGRLAEAGRFVFTVEQLPAGPGPDWLLGRSGRYRHSIAHLEAAAAAAELGVGSLGPEVLRTEHGQPVACLLAVFMPRAAAATPGGRA
jgi:predicted TPR repeat methyltransferase